MFTKKNSVVARRQKVIINEGKQQQKRTTRKNSRMTSMWKRIVGRKDRDTNGANTNGAKPTSRPLWRRKHLKRDRIESSHLEPEILRVSPLGNSCEVTLLSSYEDGPSGIHTITVTQNGKLPVDESYHVVLNPHRQKLFFDYNDDNGSSAASTHGLTTEFTPSAQSSAATCVDTHHNSSSGEETIYFVNSDEQQWLQDRHDIMIRKQSLFYESLFVASESEDGDQDEEEMQFWETGDSPRFTAEAWCDDERADAHAKLLKQQQILNTTLDTALLDDEEFTVDSRDDGFPLEIMVQI